MCVYNGIGCISSKVIAWMDAMRIDRAGIYYVCHAVDIRFFPNREIAGRGRALLGRGPS